MPTDLFNRKYRIDSIRLPGWDYSRAGYYFVTICTKNRSPYFGEVLDEVVRLSRIGEIVAEEWIKTGDIRPNVELDAWIVMPDHMHAIVVITHTIKNAVETPRRLETPRRGVSTARKWAANTLGSIIGQFKGKCTKRIWAEGHTEFAWQTRFYDRIIRTNDDLNNVRKYIISNPMNWD